MSQLNNKVYHRIPVFPLMMSWLTGSCTHFHCPASEIGSYCTSLAWRKRPKFRIQRVVSTECMSLCTIVTSNHLKPGTISSLVSTPKTAWLLFLFAPLFSFLRWFLGMVTVADTEFCFFIDTEMLNGVVTLISFYELQCRWQISKLWWRERTAPIWKRKVPLNKTRYDFKIIANSSICTVQSATLMALLYSSVCACVHVCLNSCTSVTQFSFHFSWFILHILPLLFSWPFFKGSLSLPFSHLLFTSTHP